MSTPKPVKIASLPGIKRDGTQFDGENYTDGLWCRFQRGRPRKMGGYSATTQRLDELVYGMGSFSADNSNYVHLGMASKLMQAVINQNTGILSALNDRTPSGFISSPNNVWQFDNLPDAVASVTDLIAHGAPNLADISSTLETDIYYGQADDTSALTASGLDPQSGGACAIGPYLFGFGNSGILQWSAPNDPTTFQNEARVTGQKIVAGRNLRGGGSGPAGLFWSLDSLLRATFIAGVTDPATDPVFAFDTLASEMSILSSRSIVEYNGVYYWWDISGPQMFNGVVREVPNEMNINYLLDNINFAYRQKMFAFKVPRWGEIWWCVPLFGATECNWAIILNVRENTWYDTALPDSGRTSGLYPQVYHHPFTTDADLTDTGYTLWQHETGTNKSEGSNIEPIPSHFTTADISMITLPDGAVDKELRIAVVEPDFVQSGDMTCTVSGKANARAEDIFSEPVTFPEDNGNLPADDQVVRFKENRREMRFTFATNTPNGNYEAGQTIGHIEPTGGRFTK